MRRAGAEKWQRVRVQGQPGPSRGWKGEPGPEPDGRHGCQICLSATSNIIACYIIEFENLEFKV